MKRRKFTSLGGATLGSIALNGIVRPQSTLNNDKRPNILFIMTDQQSAHMMSCTGNRSLHTPAMDRLSTFGTRFEKAYTCNPVCVPSRFSLQTGMMPSAVGIGANQDPGWTNATNVSIQKSIGNLFKSAGYDTVYGGKVHLPHRMNHLKSLGYRILTKDSRQDLADRCAGFIKEKHDKPFLLFASFINPHDICYMAINDFLRSQGKSPHGNIDSRNCERILELARKNSHLDSFINKHCPELPNNHDIPDKEPECIADKYVGSRPFIGYIRNNWGDEQWRLHRWAYCRLTEMVDAKIGILLNALYEAGLENNTLIVFTSDHGDMDAAHKLEHKSILYEEAVRIPFIMSYRGVIPEGVVNNTHLLSNGLDLLPTLCDYAGIKIPSRLFGSSIRPLVEGKPVSNWRDYIVVESQFGRMIRTSQYKYCIYNSGEHCQQLIDLRNDPIEMRNLAYDQGTQEILYKHHQLLKDWIEKSDDKIGLKYV